MKNFVINLPQTIDTVLEKLHNGGYQAYVVGGCVRDCIMGKEPNDWDITTNALPNEVKAVFCDCKVIETGIKHGTVTVLVNNTPVEITTFRTDGDYLDSRHPQNVTFTPSLKEDLKRRDFTMNAICYNKRDGIVDYFDGARDIRLRTIRAVGNPKQRFEEDALRILRALRFSSSLDFTIEKETENAIRECKELILNVSNERTNAELSKILCGKNALSVLTNFKEVIFTIIPELAVCDGFSQNTPYHIYDVYTHTVNAVCAIEPTVHLRLAMLLHDIAKPNCYTVDEKGVGHFKTHAEKGADMAHAILKRLKYDNDTVKKVTTLIKEHNLELFLDEKILLRRLNKLGEKTLFDLIKVKKADDSAKSDIVLPRKKQLDDIEKMLKNIIKSQKCFSLKNLAVNGNDVISLGVAGFKVGEILNTLLERVISGEIPNEKSILLFEAKNEIKK